MTTELHLDALDIFSEAVSSVMPDKALRRALRKCTLPHRVILIGIGKAAWSMARTAVDVLGNRIVCGAVITKYGHSKGPIDTIEIYEAGHPILDDNSVAATKRVLELTKDLSAEDCVLFLVSGGGSALFEVPIQGISLGYLKEINQKLLSRGADINEINTVRKRLSSVKGGRFAFHCSPAKIYQIVLSDVIGDRMDIIASGPAVADTSTSRDALNILDKYNIYIAPEIEIILKIDPPKSLQNVETVITGSVRELCHAAACAAEKRGYKAFIITTELNLEAREAGQQIAALAQRIKTSKSEYIPPCAVIMGGETVVHLKGSGMGGRNQELALASAEGINGLDNVVILSAGSDGTDGPTDAAGGIVDGSTWTMIKKIGADPLKMLGDNDSYNALNLCGCLIKTGPTGTNVNDLVLLLCK